MTDQTLIQRPNNTQRLVEKEDVPPQRKNNVPERKLLKPKIVIRLLAICFFGCLTGFLWFDTTYWMAGIWTALITAALFYDAVKFVDHSEMKLTAFLQSLKQNDFSVTFSESSNSDDYDLHRAFNELNSTYKSLRTEKEEQHQLLQTIVEHAAIPLICFKELDDKVYLTNDAARNLLNLPFIQSISSISRVDAVLAEHIRQILDGEKISLKIIINRKPTYLSITSRHIIFKDKNLKLIAMHDVTSELAAKEAETWQRLLKVLTHEISNSAIPLSTLSSYIYEMVTTAEAEQRKLTAEERQDILESLKTIDQRSRSLKEFVQNFRSVNQIPEPNMQRIPVRQLVDETLLLFAKQFEAENIQVSASEVTADLIYADKGLTMQVLINLIKNAIEALSNYKENKFIHVKVTRDNKRYVQLHIQDSGCGINVDDIDQIFIPFYSTKSNGSGIGLSISQQIMQKQRGDIAVQSVSGRGSVFTLSFQG